MWVKTKYLEPFPLPKLSILENQNPIVLKVDNILNVRKKLSICSNIFESLLESKFSIPLSKKLQNWYQLEFSDFIKELKKKKIKLSLSEEAEWMQYFNKQKEKALSIKHEIDQTEKELNQMVYTLYNLTEEEISIVEGD